MFWCTHLSVFQFRAGVLSLWPAGIPTDQKSWWWGSGRSSAHLDLASPRPVPCSRIRSRLAPAYLDWAKMLHIPTPSTCPRPRPLPPRPPGDGSRSGGASPHSCIGPTYWMGPASRTWPMDRLGPSIQPAEQNRWAPLHVGMSY